MRRDPQLAYNPDFVRAVKNAPLSYDQLATLVGFPGVTAVSRAINKRRVSATPKMRARLEAIRALVEFDGPIFKERAS